MEGSHVFGVLFVVALISLGVSSLLKWMGEDLVMSAKAYKILRRFQYALMIFAILIFFGLFIASEIIFK